MYWSITGAVRWTRWLVVLWSAMVVAPAAQAPERLGFDPAATSIVVRVGRSGVFGFAGHDLEIAAPVADGQIIPDRGDVTRSTITSTFDATALKVTGEGEPPKDVPEVQRVMLSGQVPDVETYPKTTFPSRKLSATQHSTERMTLRIDGELTLHGMTRALTVPVDLHLTANGLSGHRTRHRASDRLRDPTRDRRSGTVRVKDEVEIVLSVLARRP
jgi:polyisoprenoid-binding protein YceI